MKESQRDKNPEINERILLIGGIVNNGDFPKPRIESLAQRAFDKIEEIKANYGKDGLSLRPQGDTLSNIWENTSFLMDDVFPVVKDLMQRTEVGIGFEKGGIVGCVYISTEEGGDDKVDIALDDDSDNFDCRINSPETAQKLWDRSSPETRKALRRFAKMTKGKLLKIFEEFIVEYLN